MGNVTKPVIRASVVLLAILVASSMMCGPARAQSALLIMTPANPAPVIVNQPYSLVLTAAGGQAPYEWTLLPSGFSGAALSPDGSFSATFTVPGTYVFVFVVRDQLGLSATKLITVTAIYPPITISADALPKASVTEPYSYTLTASGGMPPLVWSTSSTLPPGIRLSPEGVFDGTATRTGEYPVVVEVTDSVGTKARMPYVLVVEPASLRIVTQSLPPAVVGVPFEFQLALKNGVAPYTWTVAGGVLADGLRLDASGRITGTPRLVGTYNVRIQLRDARTETVSSTFDHLITEKVRVDGTGTIRTVAGTELQQQLSASGGVPPYSYSCAAPPPGLNLGSAGLIAGLPRNPGRWTLPVQVVDSVGNRAASKIPFEVIPSVLMVREAARSALFAAVNTPYAVALAVSDGYPPYRWSIESGALPPGLTLDGNGEVRGTPRTMGAYRFVVAAEDSTRTAGKVEVEILVTAAQLSAYSDLKVPYLPVAFPYQHRVAAAGGVAPYRWSISGSPQLGATIDDSGIVSVSPKATGLFAITAIVTDATGARASFSTSVRVVPSLQSLATSTSLPGAVRGAPYAASLTALGGQGKLRWTLRGDLPRGLEFDFDKALLTGVPEETGEYEFFARAADEYGQVTERRWALKAAESAIAGSPPLIGSVSNTLVAGTLAVGVHEWISIRGEFLGPSAPAEWAGGSPAFELGGVRVLLDGRPLSLLRAGAKEIVAVTSEDPPRNPLTALEVEFAGQRSWPVLIPTVREKLTIVTADSKVSNPNMIAVLVNGKVSDWVGLTVTLNGAPCEVTGVDPVVEWPGLYTLWVRSGVAVAPQSVLKIATQASTPQITVSPHGE